MDSYRCISLGSHPKGKRVEKAVAEVDLQQAVVEDFRRCFGPSRWVKRLPLRPLTRCAETQHIIGAFVQVFGPHAFDPLSPHFKALALQGPPHQRAHVVFLQPKLPFDRLKRRPVFPRHLDHPVQIFRRPILPRKLGTLHLFGGFAGMFGLVHGEVTPQTVQCSTLRPILGS